MFRYWKRYGRERRSMTSKMNRPKVCARKKPYESLEYAELVADRIALSEWSRGTDKKLRVYLCKVCGKYHIGTLSSRAASYTLKMRETFEGFTCLHEYKHLSPPVEVMHEKD